MSATTPTIAPVFASVLKELDLLSPDHPFNALTASLSHLKNTIEMACEYANYHLGSDPDPVDVRITEVLGAVAAMANSCCDHSVDLESRLWDAKKQLAAIAEQMSGEVLS